MILALSCVALYLCNPLCCDFGPHYTPGTPLLSGPPQSALLTSLVNLCPQLLIMAYFLLLEATGFWAPHSLFFSYFPWLSFSTFFAHVLWLSQLLNTGYPGVWFLGYFFALSTLALLWSCSISTPMSLKFLFPVQTSALNASLLCAAPWTVAHRHIDHHLPPAFRCGYQAGPNRHGFSPT